MLELENDLRLSEEWQNKYAVVRNSTVIDWMDLTIDLQRSVIQRFLPDNMKHNENAIQFGLNVLRSVQTLFKDDEELMNIPLYIKYNRARRGILKKGDSYVDVPLIDFKSNQHITLSNLFNDKLATLIIAGSWS